MKNSTREEGAAMAIRTPINLRDRYSMNAFDRKGERKNSIMSESGKKSFTKPPLSAVNSLDIVSLFAAVYVSAFIRAK